MTAMGWRSALRHEVTLMEKTLDNLIVDKAPEKLIDDKAYDRDKQDQRLERERAIALIGPHKSNRMKPKKLDARTLRRYWHRRRIEQLFARI